MLQTAVQRRAVRRAARVRCRALEIVELSLLAERVIDLSARGMQVACTRCAGVGDRVLVSFQVPVVPAGMGAPRACGDALGSLLASEHGEDWFEAEAVVARVIAGRRWSDSGYAAGLEFTYFDKCRRHELLERLQRFPTAVPKPRARGARGGRGRGTGG